MAHQARAVRAPSGFRVERSPGRGRHHLLEIFPGLDALPAFRELLDAPGQLRALARNTVVEIVPGRVWMYVAPHEVPELLRKAGFTPFTSRQDCIVVGSTHLRRSARIVLCMDILHELCHVVQRRAGRDLWQEGYRYANRPTEIDAYRFAVKLAREQGASESFLREYLRVEWIAEKEYRLLLKNVGVSGRRVP